MDAIIPFTVVTVGLAVASFTDFVRFKVYNTLTFPIFFGGLAYGLVFSGWSGLLFSLAGAFTGFGVLLLPYLMGGLGAGDVKFVMAMGSWIGASLLLPAIVIGCLVVLIYHLAVIARRKGIIGIGASLQLMMLRLNCFGRNLIASDQIESVQAAAVDTESPNRGRLIPFSAMMSIGIVAAVLISWWLRTMHR